MGHELRVSGDADQEYYAVVFCNENESALPRAMFIHRDEANEYHTRLMTTEPQNCHKQRIVTISRRTVFSLSPGRLPGNE